MTPFEPRPTGRVPMIVAALVAGLLAAGAAASPPTVPSPDPSAASQATILLRMELVGGFAPFQALLTHVPTFTLYGDGVALYQPADAVAAEGRFPPLRRVTLDDDQVDALLERALDRGGLRDARPEYAVDGIADAQTTVFTVAADGVDKAVSIYGLGFEAPGSERAELRRFRQLATLLADFDAWLPDGSEVSDLVPASYRGVFTEDDPESPDLRPWPWTDLSPADLQPLEDAPAISQADLTPEQVALVTDVPSGGAFDIAIAAPDGQAAWRLALRPMLPDEAPLPVAGPAPSPSPAPAASAAPTEVAPAPADDEYDYGT